QLISKYKKLEHLAIPNDIDFFSIKALSRESMDKLTKIKPQSIGQASRVGGISPADISVLVVYLEALRKRQGSTKEAV
ncbi:MAG: tRNA uridine-5-carboxymethylaminomethyl(34) synthesis enzyme MnmG, partial [Chitinophagaceae bacterium]